MSLSVINSSHDQRRRLTGRPDSHVVLIDGDDVPRLSDYKDIFFDHRWSILGIIASALMVGAIYATLAAPVYRGNLLIQIEEPEPDGKMFLNETSGLFEIKTPASGELQVLGSRLVLGAAVDRAALQIAAEPRYLPLIGRWLSTMAEGLSTPGILGWGGYVTGKEQIDIARFSVPASLQNTPPFTVKAGVDGHYTVHHKMLAAPLEGVVGQPLRMKLPDGTIDIEVSRLEGLPGAEFGVSIFSRLRAIEQLQSRLQLVEQGRQSNVISVTLEDTDHARLTRALAAIGDQYVLQNRERKSAEAQKTLSFLAAQLPVFEQQLRISEDALAKFRSLHGTASLDEETRVWLRKTSDLQGSLLDLQQRRREADVHFTQQSPRVMLLERQVKAVQGELSALNERIASIPTAQRDSVRLERDVKVNSDLFQSMQNNVLQMRLVKEGKIGNVRLLEKADVSDAPVKPQRLLIVAFSLLLGLVAGPGLAILRTRGKSGIRNPDEVEASTGLDVYAVLPYSPQQTLLEQSNAKNRANERLLADVYPHSEPIEALRSLRVSLRATLAVAPNNRILVTGAMPGIGKSFIAGNFALVLAQSGKRVLLINADLRRGDRNFAFGLGSSAGLSEVLSGQVDYTDVVHVNVRSNLDLLTTGRLPDFPADTFESDAFVRTLDSLSSRYDFVIIDTAPILVAADAVTVALACGVVLLVARAEQGQLGELNESVRRLNQAGVPIDGLLFNGIKLDRRYNSRYYYRHRSYRHAAPQYALPDETDVLSK